MITIFKNIKRGGSFQSRWIRHLVAVQTIITAGHISRGILDKLTVESCRVSNLLHILCYASNSSAISLASMKPRSLSLRCLQHYFSTESQRGLSAVNLEHLKPKVVLDENNRKSFVAKFKARKAPKMDDGGSLAAVLVPLCVHKGELGLLYTLRSTKVSSGRGQVSFPGGMYDKEDRDLEETALRETWEELKIPREKVDVWGSGNMIDKQKLKVLPVVGYIGEVEPEKLQINADEVEEAFFLSLKDHCDLSQCRYTQYRNGYTLPVYLGGKHRIWGFTAAITHMVLKALVPDAYKYKPVHLPTILPEREEKNNSTRQL